MKNYKKLIIAISALLIVSSSAAQQDPMFTQYMFNTLVINPAYAGSADVPSFTLVHRSQWVDFEGAPTTQSLSVHAPLKFQSVAVGLSAINDAHGPVKQTGIYGDVSYRIFFDNSRLSFGLKGGMNLFTANLLDLNPNIEDDQAFATNISSRGLPNFGFGMMYYSKRWYLGISSPNNQEKQHLFLTGGVVIDISHYTKFRPTILLKAVNGAPPGLDITASFLFYEKMWAGLMYRWEDAAGVLLQYVINDKWRIGYSYDYTLSDIARYSSGSHEIMLGLDLVKRSGGEVSPRYF
jgi:type IX secretion system PorP/SprF family membrane protein